MRKIGKYSDEKRRDIVDRVDSLRADGDGIAKACEKVDIDPSQYYTWKKKLSIKNRMDSFVEVTLPKTPRKQAAKSDRFENLARLLIETAKWM